jgi:hypothetical protein
VFSPDTARLTTKQDSWQNTPSELKVIKVMYLTHPQDTRIDHHELAMQATEQYQLKQALREAKQRLRAEQNAAHNPTGRRHFRLIPRHTPATPR